jgi:hypothetical protein
MKRGNNHGEKDIYTLKDPECPDPAWDLRET